MDLTTSFKVHAHWSLKLFSACFNMDGTIVLVALVEWVPIPEAGIVKIVLEF